jgi:hypothetical protein
MADEIEKAIADKLSRERTALKEEEASLEKAQLAVTVRRNRIEHLEEALVLVRAAEAACVSSASTSPANRSVDLDFLRGLSATPAIIGYLRRCGSATKEEIIRDLKDRVQTKSDSPANVVRQCLKQTLEQGTVLLRDGKCSLPKKRMQGFFTDEQLRQHSSANGATK